MYSGRQGLSGWTMQAVGGQCGTLDLVGRTLSSRGACCFVQFSVLAVPFAPDDKCAPRSTRSLLSTASGSGRPARCETRWPVDVARPASRRRAQALIRARQHAQQHAFIFVHADSQPTCIMIRFIAEQRPLAGSKRNRRANTTRAVPPFSRLQNACRCPTCSTPCSCDCSPASSAICTGDWSRTT